MNILVRATLRFYALIEFLVLAGSLISGGLVALPLIKGPLWMDVLAGVLGTAVSLAATFSTARILDRYHGKLEHLDALRTGLH